MSGINDIDVLMKSMKPRLMPGQYVFCTVKSVKAKLQPLMVFNETEGITLILTKNDADAHKMKYEGTWRLITLTVHSDLSAVGFLARITTALATVGIGLNAVSAYYHDHLFVSVKNARKATLVLRKISR